MRRRYYFWTHSGRATVCLCILCALASVTAAQSGCTPLGQVVNSGQDAGPAINCWIQQTGLGVLSMPPGTYTIGTQIVLDRPVLLQTTGTANTGQCGVSESNRCAYLQAAPGFVPGPPTQPGIVYMTGSDLGFDHVILDGNKLNRYTSSVPGLNENFEQYCLCGEPSSTGACTGYRPRATNAQMACASNCQFTSSVSENAVCGSGLVVSGPSPTGGAPLANQVTVVFSQFTFNGFAFDIFPSLDPTASPQVFVSDGLTMLGATNSTFSSNIFADDTDFSLILGGCMGCDINGNVFQKNNAFTHSNAELGFFDFSNPADYSGSQSVNNQINCGPYNTCDYAIYVGSWYNNRGTVSGNLKIENNVITNPTVGINIDGGSAFSATAPLTLTGNEINGWAGALNGTQYGFIPSALNIAPSASNIVQSGNNSNAGPVPVTNYEYSCGLGGPGTVLGAGSAIASCDGRFSLVMQGDGNLVLYVNSSGTPLWWSGTEGHPGAFAVMQGDGNFVVYSAQGQALWWSGTSGHPGAFLEVQTDGNLVVYAPGWQPLWASGTCCH